MPGDSNPTNSADTLDALFAAAHADGQRAEEEARAGAERERRRQKAKAKNEQVRELLHSAFRHSLAFVLAIPEASRADARRHDAYRRRAKELGNDLPAAPTAETVAAVIEAAGLAADSGCGRARLDMLPVPGPADDGHFRPLHFLVQLLRLGRAGRRDEIARHLGRLAECPSLQRFLDWFGPVADALCGYETVADGIPVAQELPLPPGNCTVEARMQVARALGLRLSPAADSSANAPAVSESAQAGRAAGTPAAGGPDGAPGAAKRSSAAPPSGGPVEPRSWTQHDLDAAIHVYKSRRASSYHELVEAVQKGKPGAIEAARKMFGRNALVKALGVKAPAMVSKSEAWQEIVRELRLPRRGKGSGGLRGDRRIGTELALERKGEEAGDTTAAEVTRRETIELARQRLAPKEAEDLVSKLERGETDDDDAREIIRLASESMQDDRSRKTRPSP
jgi:hypothetical protein